MIEFVFIYASSSTLYPCRSVARWAEFETSVASRPASLIKQNPATIQDYLCLGNKINTRHCLGTCLLRQQILIVSVGKHDQNTFSVDFELAKLWTIFKIT